MIKKKINLFTFSVFVILSVTSAFHCKKFSKKEAEKIASISDANIEHGMDVEMIYTEMGMPSVKIIAPKANRHLEKEPYMEFPEGVELYMYDGKMNIESQLKADYGYAKEDRQEMIARKNVVVVNIDGDTLKTEELIWDQKEKIIYSNTFVEIRTPEEIIYGEGLEADEKFSNYTIKKITGTIQIKEDEKISETP